jgi:uncharacterized HAD superfamily protein
MVHHRGFLLCYSNFMKDLRPGIALDIDDTISDTLHHFVRLLQEKFPNPEHASIDEVIGKYKIVPHMLFWQTPEVKAWLEAQAISNEAQENVAVITGAPEIVTKLNTVVPVRMYITSRPSIVTEGTKRWLEKNNFPPAPVMTRPHSKHKIDGNAWKAEILKKMYPSVVGIVDDNPEIVGALGKEYPGIVFLFGNHYNNVPVGATTVICPSWDDAFREITTRFQ